MSIIISIALLTVVILAAIVTIRNRKPVTQIAAIPEGHVLMAEAELAEIEDRIMSIFELGYKAALTGAEYEIEGQVITITRTEKDRLVIYEYNPLVDESPRQITSHKLPGRRQSAFGHNILSVVEPEPPPVDYENFA
jgi:hypothetical protein